MSSNQEDLSKQQAQAQAQDNANAQAQPQGQAAQQAQPQTPDQAQQPKAQDNAGVAMEEEEEETPLDYYEALGLKHGTTPARIERAYKNMALRYHPQHYFGSDRAANETRFAHISEAYQVLSDPEKRRAYDEYLKKNNDKFREFQDKHRAEQKAAQKQWRQLPVLHFRFHPYSPFQNLFGYRPMNPFEQFNHFLTQGLFDDDDLDFYGWRNRPQLMYGGHPALQNQFFGDQDIRRLIHGLHDHEHQHQHQHQQQQPQQQQGQVQEQRKQAQPSGNYEISRSVIKHTKIENGVRTTITETKKVNADGHVEHHIKEETEDAQGHKRVRFLDALPEHKKKEISDHQGRQAVKEQKETKN